MEVITILGVILVCIVILIAFVLVAFGYIYVLKSKLAKNKEKKAYETMLLNPCDSTVKQYIPIFLNSQYNLKIGLGGVYFNTEKQIMEDKLRQAQGYKVIVKNPNVSDSIKEQLRKTLVSKGVPIQ